MVIRLPEFSRHKSLLSIDKYFHVSADSRKKYQFDENIFSQRGTLIVQNFASARKLADKINKTREETKTTAGYVTPGQVNALGLLHELIHMVLQGYEENDNPGVFDRSLKYLSEKLGEDKFSKILKEFINQFPPLQVYKKSQTTDQFLKSFTNGKSNKEIIIEELIILHLENLNPAFNSLKELFDNEPLVKKTQYKEFVAETKLFFAKEPPVKSLNMPLIDALEKVILENPDRIVEQLLSFKEFWGIELQTEVEDRILSGTDLLYEDSKLFVPHGGKGSPPVPSFKIEPDLLKKIKKQIKSGKKKNIEWDELELTYMVEEEKFTADIDWMPNVVMIAKNTLVWLDQLSKTYGRKIDTLDKIPDSELDILASRNFNALWLIGIWERSDASMKIKQFCGNPDATSSAYSLYDYEIATVLGGEPAYQVLKAKCALRNIRLASDMVPNHTGLYSKWTVERPEYFIQTQEPPFPSYTFTGPNLSDNEVVELKIEDKYYTRQDAAVVFRHVDKRTKQTRYIYHGNDGTNMAWNDTAQLNLLDPVVREELIQTIMKVAKKFSIIRFDAAMILAKKHYQRLWYPVPGQGGAIPSRADYAITKQLFHKLMPNEFWREVVDRINEELPNTLLLAEAFWLMEGYFVRSLGMHRVYNSAFMHMMMKEENAKYRSVIKNTIEFDPEILKRYVNFMSNPDEETAVNQFGKGDKYFGICVMMCTLPGLPMFAHGQIEGLTEKYGMEYKRAYYNEQPDEYLIYRHSKEIFPILSKRYIFSEAKSFELFDYISDNRTINDNVFAFTNSSGNEKTLVFYNNSYFPAMGYIRNSSGKRSKAVYIEDKSKDPDWENAFAEDEKANPNELEYKTLVNYLGIKNSQGYFYIYRDYISGKEFIRTGTELYSDGFRISLGGYKSCVFLDFKEVIDTTGEYRRVYDFLAGSGVTSIEMQIKELRLEPFHKSISELISKEPVNELRYLLENSDDSQIPGIKFSKDLEIKLRDSVRELCEYLKVSLDSNEILDSLLNDLKILAKLKNYLKSEFKKSDKELETAFSFFVTNDAERGSLYAGLLNIYLVLRKILGALSKVKNKGAYELYQGLLLNKPVWHSLLRLSDRYNEIKTEFDLLNIFEGADEIFDRKGMFNPAGSETSINSRKLPTVELLEKTEVKEFLGLNSYNGVNYYGKENLEILLKWVYSFNLYRFTSKNSVLKESGDIQLPDNFKLILTGITGYLNSINQLSVESGFEYDKFIASVNEMYFKKEQIIESNRYENKKSTVKKTSTKKADKAGLVKEKSSKAKKIVRKEKDVVQKTDEKK
ncbi:MAG: hypothetical protein IAE91_02990, partial [Ignavibacteriaceae bacterium]|nr:hypothetical protein [Ignavibacteriaceae bacterium]